ncbi:MAG: MFS transporter, partial [Cellulomonadaceae bacterium]|nr:MFS transporter [Cellulomonadaceae bacterium]
MDPDEASGTAAESAASGWYSQAARRLEASNALDITSRNIMSLVTDALAVVYVGANATQIGLLNAAGTVAFLVLGAPIGVWIDRADARKAMVLATFSRSAVCLLLAFAIARGHTSFYLLAIVSLLIGISGTVAETGQTVHATQVVEKSSISLLISRLSAVDKVLRLAVPAATGLALGLMGAPWLMVFAALISLSAGIVLLNRGNGNVVSNHSEMPKEKRGKGKSRF